VKVTNHRRQSPNALPQATLKQHHQEVSMRRGGLRRQGRKACLKPVLKESIEPAPFRVNPEGCRRTGREETSRGLAETLRLCGEDLGGTVAS
jgi:hypothetical protein